MPNAVAGGEMKPCEGTDIIARVGSEAILEADVMGPINERIEANKDRIPPEQVDELRKMMVKQQLPQLMEVKLICLDAKRKIPSESWPHIEERVFQGVRRHRTGENDKEGGGRHSP